jgi:FkbM family methyltransferase
MSHLFSRLATVFNAVEHFGNPLQIAAWRLFRKPEDCITIVDRASGVRCLCNLGSHHMFSEVWHTHVYDVRGVSIRPGDVVLDIGANQGFFTCYAAQKGAKVFAFEPVPELFERLVFNVKRNGFADRVTALQYAIAAFNGEVDLQISDSLGGGQSSIIPEFTKSNQVSVGRTIQAPCKTLSQVLADYSIPAVRLCKLDVEGAELEILRALTSPDLAKLQSIAMEYHPGAYPMRELSVLLEGWGTHHVSLMDERPYAGDILRCVRKGVLEF